MNLADLQKEAHAIAKSGSFAEDEEQYMNICELQLEDLRPSDTPAYMNDAWLGCLVWAISQPDVVAQFREETGNKWVPGKTPIDRMVDDATGASRQFIMEFVEWANVNVWGPIS